MQYWKVAINVYKHSESIYSVSFKYSLAQFPQFSFFFVCLVPCSSSAASLYYSFNLDKLKQAWPAQINVVKQDTIGAFRAENDRPGSGVNDEDLGEGMIF